MEFHRCHRRWIQCHRNGIKQNATLLTGAELSDTFSLGTDPVSYAVTAVNSTNAESAARLVTVYAVNLGLLVNAAGGTTNNPPVTGYFDDYLVSVSNLTATAALPLQQVGLLRQASGTTPLNIVNPVNSAVVRRRFVCRRVVGAVRLQHGPAIRPRAGGAADGFGRQQRDL